MVCQCDWIFETFNYNIYTYKTDKTYLICKNTLNKMTTLEWGDWLYCDKCYAYVGIKFKNKYPSFVSLSLSEHLINDIKLHILGFYHAV
jgi:hypothetical protein